MDGHILLSILFLLMVVYLECFGHGIKLPLTVSWLGSGNDHRPIARLKVCSGRLERHSWLTVQSGVAINSTKARGSPYDLSLSLSHTETVKSHAWSLTFKGKTAQRIVIFQLMPVVTSKNFTPTRRTLDALRTIAGQLAARRKSAYKDLIQLPSRPCRSLH